MSQTKKTAKTVGIVIKAVVALLFSIATITIFAATEEGSMTKTMTKTKTLNSAATLTPIISSTATANTTTAATNKSIPPLIPREILFGNPEKTSPSISPDGTRIAFLAPLNNVLNIWVTPPNDTDLTHAKPITKETKRHIRSYFWSYDNQHILYTQDQNGDENFHLYSINLGSNFQDNTHKAGVRAHQSKVNSSPRALLIKDLTPFPKVRVNIIKTSQNFPAEMLIGLNNTTPEWHDVYRLNIITGKLKLIEKNRRFSDFIADENLQLRIASKPTAENSPEFYIKNAAGEWEFYERAPFEDALSTAFLGLNKEGTIAHKLDSIGRDKAAIYAVDLNTKKKTLIAESRKADCSDLLIHPTELTPQAFAYEYTKVVWEILDKRIKKDFSYLKNAALGEFEVTYRTLADDKWIIRYYSDTAPSSFYLYERDPISGKPLRLTFLFTTMPILDKQPLNQMQPVIIKARDGLKLVSYLTLTQANTQSMPMQPAPTVLLVHGGPWARDSWGLNILHQWLANRGYNVLSVNYRGSTGFGKAFINAGNQEWGRNMHHDLVDAVQWAIDQNIADPQKIVIMGGSYGGYATLVGMTFTPDLFCGGVDIVGPSNLFTLINSVPPYWKPEIALFKKRIGDIDTAAGKQLLRERSPLTYVDHIKKPLLILQGEHDPRVKKAEADQIVNKMKEKHIPVTYVLYHDEGHGFVRQPNRMSSNAIIEQFLAKVLGGRAEPIAKNEFRGANFSVVEGEVDRKL
jgi:dipeptidyl aminopeptidase/acylaminoacyl peptidase